MKKFTLILAAIAFNLFAVEAMAQNGTREGVVVEIEPISSIDVGSSSVSKWSGKIVDQETGIVYPFELRGIEKDHIKRGMLVSFIVPPGADVAAAHNNNTRAPINFVYDKDAAQ